jgi:hypothetical protein
MPSVSKSQQRLMGMAYAVKSGDMKISDIDPAYRDKVKSLSDGMTKKDLKKYASTKHDNLPETVDEAFIGPFVFNDSMSDEELLGMYNGALDGYANYAKGMHYSKSEYKKAYQEIEKILKKRGVAVDEDFAHAAQNITPSANIGGMGPVVLPSDGGVGSGDVPSVADIDDDEEEAKKDKTKKKLEMENFNLYTQFNSFVGESLVSEAFKFGKKNQYSIDDVNESYGFWGTLDTAGFRRKDIEDCWHSAMAWLTEAYKFSDAGALYYLNAKAGRWIADQVIEQKGNKDVVDVLEDYATDAEWKKWSKEYNKFAQEEMMSEATDSKIYEEALLENAVRDLHFETDPKKAEDMKIAIGTSQGEVSRRKQIEGGEYSLRRFRKEIKYGDGKDLGVFIPGSYDAATSTLGDGPHKKAVKKVRWNRKKYDQWIEDVASNDGWKNAFDMAQNAKHEPGLLQWAKKEFRGEDVMQRIQWDIEGYAESVVIEAESVKVGEYIKTQYGYFYKRVDGKVGGQEAFVEIKKGKEGKRKTSIHDTVSFEIVDKDAAFESLVTEKKHDREDTIKFIKKYMRFVKTTEEFNGSQGGIWVSGEDGDEYKGVTIYDYYTSGKSYELGVNIKWEKELNKRGWYSEWYDAGTVMIWEI